MLTFARHTDALLDASRAAEAQSRHLEEQRTNVSVEKFLQTAAYIVERLQSLSVDISRIFQPNIDDKTWQEFHDGDRSVFLRKTLKTLDRQQIAAIKTRYEEDDQFRDYVNRYLAEFDFRYSNRVAMGIDDGVRSLIALKGVRGKRLTYRRPVEI